MSYARHAWIVALVSFCWGTGCSAPRGESWNDTPIAAPRFADPTWTNAPSACAPEEPATPAPKPPAVSEAAAPAPMPASTPPPPGAQLPDPVDRLGPLVWGVAGVRGYALGERTAPNGVGYDALFSLELDFNLWLWRQQGVYAFNESNFWGQRAAPGITNPSQGAFDFSKREFDETIGLAWNYYGNFEARAFAYSFNNLNRGSSAAQPAGFKDGAGFENRWYVGGSYPDLGRPGFDVARATFVSVGYYPTKEMVDLDGNGFQPGPFARAYLTLDLFGPRYYLYSDLQLIGERNWRPKQSRADVGFAMRPFAKLSYLEFRIGTEDVLDFQLREWAVTLYGAVRFVF
jgi:hypothetical protein